ncbi:hypothetical protein ACUXZZ_45170 (plasmid) [Streptomyces graminifolii]|uniref:hypothetical protein n=1 Tax=Streptomyces graminifolii TaxID=1266771 RepID=UPI00405970A1
MSTVDTVRQIPTNAEVGQARAYFQGIVSGFSIVLDDWTGIGDGTAKFTDAEGTTLLYTGDELHQFDAIIPCAVHRIHRYGVSTPEQLDEVRATTAECSAKAAPAPVPPPPVDDQPTMTIRVVTDPDAPAVSEPPLTPVPLWLITHAADTPGLDRQTTTAS